MNSDLTRPLYQCLTKATTATGDQMKYGPNWVVARRARLKVFPDRLECGDWTIPNEEITEAVLFSIRSLVFIPGYVLRVTTDEATYHFGLNGGAFWKGELPFPVTRKKGSLGYSKLSIAVRVIALGDLVYALWQWLAR